jgi:phage tail-like protein
MAGKVTTALIQGETGGMYKKKGTEASAEDVRGNWKAKKAMGAGMSQVSGAVQTGIAAAEAALAEATGFRLDPAPAYLFTVELGGLLVATFSECSGLDLEREVEEVVEGGNNAFTHKFAGRNHYSNITLKRGITVSPVLWLWYHTGKYDAKVLPINFSIILGAPMQSPLGALPGEAGLVADWGFTKLKHWDVDNAWPVKWVGPTLDTNSTSVAFEEIEIAHHGIYLSPETMTPMNIAGTLVNTFA